MLAALSTLLIGASTFLPTVALEEFVNPNLIALGLDNALIQVAPGWVLLGLAAASAAALALWYALGRGRFVVALALIATGLGVGSASARFEQRVVNPCDPWTTVHYKGFLPDCFFEHGILPAGYAFDVARLGGAGSILAGVLLLVGGKRPLPRRQRVPGREDVVWL